MELKKAKELRKTGNVPTKAERLSMFDQNRRDISGYHKEVRLKQEQMIKRLNKMQAAKRISQDVLRRESIVKAAYKQGIMGVENPNATHASELYRKIKQAEEKKQLEYSLVMAGRRKSKWRRNFFSHSVTQCVPVSITSASFISQSFA